LTRCFKRFRRGKIRPIVDRTFPLDEARDAQTYFKQVLSIFLIGPFFQFWLEQFRRLVSVIDRAKVDPV
ncbi:hypothetical protein ACW7EJ_16045, partial [Acinetobacter soli]